MLLLVPQKKILNAYLLSVCFVFFAVASSAGQYQIPHQKRSVKIGERNSASGYSKDSLTYFSQQKTTTLDAMDSLYRNGTRLMQERDLESAGDCYTKGLEMAKKEQDSLYVGRFYNGLAAVEQHKKEIESALLLYHKSLDYLREEQYPSETAKIYANLGALYAGLEDFSNAQKYLERALALSTDANVLKLQIMTNLSALYFDMGDLDNGESLVLETIQLAEALGNDYVISVLYTNLSKIYSENQRWEEAIKAGEKALDIKNRIQQGSPLATLNNVGHAYQMSGQYDKALLYYKKALPIAIGDERILVLTNLKNTAREMGDYSAALSYFEDLESVKDSIALMNLKAQISDITEKYETNKKQQHIDNLQAENELQRQLIKQQQLLAFGALAILMLFAGLIYIWQKQLRTKQALDRSSLQQRFLLSQLNPHFIFNALQSVQHYIYKNDTKKSMEYLNRFGKLIRAVLESSDQEFISLEEEVQMLLDFLSLHQLNSNDTFDFEIILGDNLDLEGTCIPVMLIQPFVENAIVHGIKGRKGGLIEVRFEIENNILKTEILDNGSGINHGSNKADKALHRSMGREIINNRIKEYNSTHKDKIMISYFAYCDDPDFPGTKVLLEIPLEKV